MGAEYRYIYPVRQININDASAGLSITQSGAGLGIDLAGASAFRFGADVQLNRGAANRLDFASGDYLSIATMFIREGDAGGSSFANIYSSSGSIAIKASTDAGADVSLIPDTGGSLLVNFAAAANLIYTAGSFAFQVATTLAFGAFNSTISASSAGIARSIAQDITIGAGGASGAVLQHAFNLDSVIEAGLLGETDGAGTYTQAKSVWKVPYRDAGAGAIGPTAPTTAATWNGGMSVQASDAVPNGRIYIMSNETQRYIDMTAGFGFLYEEPITFGNFNHDGQKPWQYGDIMTLRVDRYTEDGGHALPYPFSKALKEQMITLLDTDVEFLQQIKEKLNA